MFYDDDPEGPRPWNAAFFCGPAAVLRREALEQAADSPALPSPRIAETALELHSRGWKSIYVDKPLVAGLQPETFSSPSSASAPLVHGA